MTNSGTSNRTNPFFRFAKRALMLLALALLCALLLIHIPAIQQIAARKITTFLSSKTNSTVAIDHLSFNILGDISLEGIEAIDPDSNLILSAKNIEIELNPIELIRGKFHVQKVLLEGAEGRLGISEDELNINYFIDAFRSADTATVDEKSKRFSLRIDQIDFQDVLFKFQSHPTVDLSVKLATLEASDFFLNTNPLSIESSTLISDSLYVDVSTDLSGSANAGVPKVSNKVPSEDSTRYATAASTIQLPDLDFGIGFPLDVGSLDLRHAAFSYHVTEIVRSKGFDPEHLEFDDIRTVITGLSFHEDALLGKIDTLSADLPIIGLAGISGQIAATKTDLTISELMLRLSESYTDIDATAKYSSWSDLLNENGNAVGDISLSGKLAPADLAYFLPDSVQTYLDHWSPVIVDLDANVNNTDIGITTCDFRVGDSHASLNGSIKNVQHGIDAISWDAIHADMTVGSEFYYTLSQIADSAYLPDTMQIQIKSTGRIDTFDLEANINTNWCVVNASGAAGIKDSSLYINMDIDGNNLDLATIGRTDMLDKCDVSLHAQGHIDQEISLFIDGYIKDLSVLDKVICEIRVESQISQDSVSGVISILDSLYKLELNGDVILSEQTEIQASLLLDAFHLGHLLGRDTSAIISGLFITDVALTDSLINGYVRGGNIYVATDDGEYGMDTLDLIARVSPDSSNVALVSDDVIGAFYGNFDLRKFDILLDSIITENFRVKPNPIAEISDKTFDFHINVKNDDLLRLAGVELEKFDGARLTGHLDQKARALSLEANTGRFEGLGMSTDTISFNFSTNVDELNSQVHVRNIEYDSMRIGDLNFSLFSDTDTSGSVLSLTQDSIVLIDLVTRLSISEKGLDIYPDHLVLLEQTYQTQWANPVFVNRDSFAFDQLVIRDTSKELRIHGNSNQFDVTLDNIQLKNLNYFFSRDSALINSGRLDGDISYDKNQQLLDATIQIDSLSISHSAMIDIEAEAHTEGSTVPFNISLSSQSNNIHLGGNYVFNSQEIDANLTLEVNNAEDLEFFTQTFLDKLSGSLSGNLQVKGPIAQPDYNGVLSIKELQVIAKGTGSTVNINNQELELNDRGMKFNDFTIFDQNNNPLVISGAIKTDDFKSIEYDLNVYTDNYTLFEHPYSDDGPALQGVLAVASDIKLTGNQNETQLDVEVTVLDTSSLTYIMPEKEIEFVTDEGIVRFVDPNAPIDSADYKLTPSFYDSLLATLPSLDLVSHITLEKNASLKVIVDPRSGDYMEASGAADLELKLDRTGNLQLNGKYVLTNGFYQLSFYGIAKKKFEIAPESEIQWNGDPTNGDLDIVAIHTVKSSSTGLIGHEVGENEQSLYRKALNYMVGIVIKGTIEKPEVSFTLDLPDDDKVNYPALGNKLSRLAQPEFESELNKQVFGLLVLGGFVPESGGSEMGELAVATTISNSVSSILTGQLNRFINDNVEGIEVDIGMHSYSDYSTGGSKTRTAMDFRVTKRMMNDRLSFEVGAEVDINADQSGANTGQNSFRGDIAVIYDLNESGTKKLKAFNNETYDIIYHEIRNTGIAFILVKEFDRKKKVKEKGK